MDADGDVYRSCFVTTVPLAWYKSLLAVLLDVVVDFSVGLSLKKWVDPLLFVLHPTIPWKKLASPCTHFTLTRCCWLFVCWE